MSIDSRNELYLAMRKKKLKARTIAAEIGISASLLSQFFSGKANMNIENENNLKNYIEGYGEGNECV
ncbi:helix-turn-helix domain-containing protein [Lysinibacillus sp. NPDC097214]|uniref:helix-turn-helix domain-containing protein n=1 Tax=Lysinibacillus sp. NPDC097214 TaxID=3390584 RepID=UPI003D016F4A